MISYSQERNREHTEGRTIMIKALVEYVSRNGRTIVKGFHTLEEAFDFCAKLDKRIEKGTCTGYLMTELN